MRFTLRSARLLLPLAATGAVLTLAACGDDDGGSGTGGSTSGGDDREAIEEVVTDYGEAFGERDFDEACALLTAEAVRQIEAAASEIDASGCADALDKATAQIGDEDRERLGDIEVTSIEIDGDVATVQTRIPGIDEPTDPATLRRENGEWRISPTGTEAQTQTATTGTPTTP